jgi:Protein of unknown function (DUF2475)
MGIQEETVMLSGFAGFVPGLKYQFGLTFGNATRTILDTDPSMKKGKIQKEFHRRYHAAQAAQSDEESSAPTEGTDDAFIWKGHNKVNIGSI